MSYTPQYYLAWGVAAIGVLAGILSGVGYTGLYPSWLTQDIAATAGIISAVCVGLAALLPQVTRTPGTREAKYLSAVHGILPNDIAAKHGIVVPDAPPQKPLDTL